MGLLAPKRTALVLGGCLAASSRVPLMHPGWAWPALGVQPWCRFALDASAYAMMFQALVADRTIRQP